MRAPTAHRTVRIRVCLWWGVGSTDPRREPDCAIRRPALPRGSDRAVRARMRSSPARARCRRSFPVHSPPTRLPRRGPGTNGSSDPPALPPAGLRCPPSGGLPPTFPPTFPLSRPGSAASDGSTGDGRCSRASRVTDPSEPAGCLRSQGTNTGVRHRYIGPLWRLIPKSTTLTRARK